MEREARLRGCVVETEIRAHRKGALVRRKGSTCKVQRNFAIYRARRSRSGTISARHVTNGRACVMIVPFDGQIVYTHCEDSDPLRALKSWWICEAASLPGGRYFVAGVPRQASIYRTTWL